MPVIITSPYAGTVNRASKLKSGPTQKQLAADARKAIVESSALDKATERALNLRTVEARRAVLELMGKGTR